MPPTASTATVSSPVTEAQTMRCQAAQSSWTLRRLEHRLPITSAPESAEVT